MVITLQNHAVHQSQRHLDAMNGVLCPTTLYPTGPQRGNNRFHNVDAWLKATPTGHGQTRLSIIINTLDQIGKNF